MRRRWLTREVSTFELAHSSGNSRWYAMTSHEYSNASGNMVEGGRPLLQRPCADDEPATGALRLADVQSGIPLVECLQACTTDRSGGVLQLDTN
jgi:hypothetical protein